MLHTSDYIIFLAKLFGDFLFYSSECDGQSLVWRYPGRLVDAWNSKTRGGQKELYIWKAKDFENEKSIQILQVYNCFTFFTIKGKHLCKQITEWYTFGDILSIDNSDTALVAQTAIMVQDNNDGLLAPPFL